MPTIKLIICLIFIPSRSVTPCLVVIARARDFAVLLKVDADSLFGNRA
jgi:hypothetical protein